MFDMRYHVASIVAVFFALAIGLLLGTVIVDKGILVDQQQALVKRIEANINDLREENRTLKEEVSAQRKFANKVIPLSIKDRLAGQTIVIISTTKIGSDVVSELSDGLKKAGAAVSVANVDVDFELTEEAKQALAPYFATPVTDENSRELIIKKVAEELTLNSPVNATTTTTTNQKIPYLEQVKNLGLLTIDGSNANAQKTSVILLGGANEDLDPEKMDLYIVDQLKATGVRVVGVEVSECKNSYMELYQKVGIPTVDNIDQPMGLISVVFSLNGADGNFGIKKTADQLMPSFPSS